MLTKFKLNQGQDQRRQMEGQKKTKGNLEEPRKWGA